MGIQKREGEGEGRRKTEEPEVEEKGEEENGEEERGVGGGRGGRK